MCGIVSIVSSGEVIDPHRLKKAADALAHRGPDGAGFWYAKDGQVGIGHRRLSIIDHSTGAQPISNEDRTLHVAVNGEFYGFEALRHSLEQKGHCFRTSSDSEIVLHLYEEYGFDFTHHLRGEFAFILYDETQRRMIAVRDRFGIKPLCYAQDTQGTFYLASEAKALFAAGYKAEWDEYAFFHACNAQYVPADRTLFEGVHQLPPGHMLIIENHKTSLKKYWDMDYPSVLNDAKTDKEWMDEFYSKFEESIRLRLRADVPICFHLSGGLDSSAVAALGIHLYGKPLDCFTISFAEEGYDELPFAREMATKMGTTLHTISVSQDDLVQYLPEAVYYSEGLAINGHLAGKFLLSKAIHEAGFKVALTGEGSDELLAGYPHFREDLMGVDHTIASHRKALHERNDKLAGIFLAHGDTLPTDGIEDVLGFTPSFLRAKASLGFRMMGILSEDFKSKKLGDIYADIAQAFDVENQLRGRHVVNQSSYLWTKLTLATYILRTLGDGCEMASAVEGRLPFLDHKLFEFCRAMPIHLKIRDMVEKYILRETVKPFLTDTVYKRQKHPFIAPPVSRFSNPALNMFVQDTLRSTAFNNMPFFDQGQVMNWLDNLPKLSGKDINAAEPVLMMMLTSFLIHKRFDL